MPFSSKLPGRNEPQLFSFEFSEKMPITLKAFATSSEQKNSRSSGTSVCFLSVDSLFEWNNIFAVLTLYDFPTVFLRNSSRFWRSFSVIIYPSFRMAIASKKPSFLNCSLKLIQLVIFTPFYPTASKAYMSPTVFPNLKMMATWSKNELEKALVNQEPNIP